MLDSLLRSYVKRNSCLIYNITLRGVFKTQSSIPDSPTFSAYLRQSLICLKYLKQTPLVEIVLAVTPHQPGHSATVPRGMCRSFTPVHSSFSLCKMQMVSCGWNTKGSSYLWNNYPISMPVILFQLHLLQVSHFWSPTIGTIIPVCQMQPQKERFSKSGYISGGVEDGEERQRCCY